MKGLGPGGFESEGWDLCGTLKGLGFRDPFNRTLLILFERFKIHPEAERQQSSQLCCSWVRGLGRKRCKHGLRAEGFNVLGARL